MPDLRRILCAMLTVASVTAAPLAQETGPPLPRLIPHSVAGQDLYQFFCATCHGRNGKGNGPVAPVLKNPVPDLTRLSQRHGDQFPRERVEAFVANDGGVLAPTHGSAEMPVWGPIFQGLEPSDALTKVRIANVVGYIESIQVR